MGLTNEHVGPKILAKIKIYVLTKAELLFQVCYEIPCTLLQLYCSQQGCIEYVLVVNTTFFAFNSSQKFKISRIYKTTLLLSICIVKVHIRNTLLFYQIEP